MIASKDIKLTKLSEIKINPNNRNNHPKDQIERLCKVIEYQGFRSPLIVSNRTGMLVAGHGRLLAARKLKMIEVPVMFQDFQDESQEYACMVSDNAIASWSELDLSSINTDIGDLGPDFDIDLLGLPNFAIEPADKFLNKELWQDDFEHPEDLFCRVVISIETEEDKIEVFNRLNITKTKNFKDGKVISINWSENKDE